MLLSYELMIGVHLLFIVQLITGKQIQKSPWLG